jgi:hypothetical protein
MLTIQFNIEMGLLRVGFGNSEFPCFRKWATDGSNAPLFDIAYSRCGVAPASPLTLLFDNPIHL